MLPTTSFTRFEIRGLHGKTFIAEIDSNTLILVGENGSGKTTFLRILFNFLSGRWGRLAQFDFQSVTATIDGQRHAINHSDLSETRRMMDEQDLGWLPPSQRRHIRELTVNGQLEEATQLLTRWANRYESAEAIVPFFQYSERLVQLRERLRSSLGAQLLYLPTYRRIERELSSILQGLDPDEKRRASTISRQAEDAPDYIELVEFGMNDVKEAIKNTLEGIRNFQLLGTTRLSLTYLGDVVTRKYDHPATEVISSAPQETIEAVINRVDSTILSIYKKSDLREMILSKKNVSSLSEHEKIIYHYFAKLVEFQRELESKETNIRMFCKICSEYITDKRFIYESDKFVFRIEQVLQGNEIELSDLSSGEKQIVSLFSHLFLSGRDSFFVLIDEPELSLSVPWQRRFLMDIRNAVFCSGLVAVTHSPFIYDNELRRYTHGLGEFISGPDWGNI